MSILINEFDYVINSRMKSLSLSMTFFLIQNHDPKTIHENYYLYAYESISVLFRKGSIGLNRPYVMSILIENKYSRIFCHLIVHSNVLFKGCTLRLFCFSEGQYSFKKSLYSMILRYSSY